MDTDKPEPLYKVESQQLIGCAIAPDQISMSNKAVKSPGANLLIVAGLLVLVSCMSVRSPELTERHNHPSVGEVKQLLNSIIIPRVNLGQTTADCALAFWSQATLENAPQHVGVSSVVQGETGGLVHITGANMSSLDLLNDICRQAKLVWWMTPTCLMIAPR